MVISNPRVKRIKFIHKDIFTENDKKNRIKNKTLNDKQIILCGFVPSC